MNKIDLIIADDHQLFVEGLKRVLSSQDSFVYNLVLEATNGIELCEGLKEIQADLLLLDLNMPYKDGFEVLQDVRKKYPTLRIIALTMYDEVKLVKSAFNAGIDGYVLKSYGLEDLLIAIDDVMQGKRHLGKGVALVPDYEQQSAVMTQKIYEDKFMQKYNLTKREIEVLLLITEALSNKEIAKELFISDQTVSVHRKNLMRKIGVSNTAGLIRFAFDKSLI